jgi:hypothetical protein
MHNALTALTGAMVAIQRDMTTMVCTLDRNRKLCFGLESNMQGLGDDDNKFVWHRQLAVY